MTIGFDAKRAFHNKTGLGNYSRTLISSLAKIYQHDNFVLFNPKSSTLFQYKENNIIEIQPKSIFNKWLPAIWRSFTICHLLNKRIDIYHGLSNELPFGIQSKKVKKVVSIHDIIFEYYPNQYNKFDVWMYRLKFKYACKVADKIIAISEATKNDIIEKYHIDAHKIEVCYQSYDPRFLIKQDANLQTYIAKKYKLNKPYFLSVGSLIARKNVMHVCKAFNKLIQTYDIELVIIGKGNSYKQVILQYLLDHQISNRVHFLEDHFNSSEIYDDLPQLYQQAKALVYPSFKEGFGIPILEAMASGTAVITSNISSLYEIGNHAALCIDPSNVESIADAMKQILNDETYRQNLISKGYIRLKQFSNDIAAEQTMQVYKNLLYHE